MNNICLATVAEENGKFQALTAVLLKILLLRDKNHNMQKKKNKCGVISQTNRSSHRHLLLVTLTFLSNFTCQIVECQVLIQYYINEGLLSMFFIQCAILFTAGRVRCKFLYFSLNLQISIKLRSFVFRA